MADKSENVNANEAESQNQLKGSENVPSFVTERDEWMLQQMSVMLERNRRENEAMIDAKLKAFKESLVEEKVIEYSRFRERELLEVDPDVPISKKTKVEVPQGPIKQLQTSSVRDTDLGFHHSSHTTSKQSSKKSLSFPFQTKSSQSSDRAKCRRCGKSHRGECLNPINCRGCGEEGHKVFNCPQKIVVCFECGDEGHISRFCPNKNPMPIENEGTMVTRNAGGSSFHLKEDEEPKTDMQSLQQNVDEICETPNTNTGILLLNSSYTFLLFEFGAKIVSYI